MCSAIPTFGSPCAPLKTAERQFDIANFMRESEVTLVGVLHGANDMPYGNRAAGAFRSDAPIRRRTVLTVEEVERITGLVRDLRQRLMSETPVEVVEPPSRPFLARAIGRAFRRP